MTSDARSARLMELVEDFNGWVLNNREGSTNAFYLRVDRFCKESREAIDELEALVREAGSTPADRESVAVQHARKQGAADGFQAGWHCVIERIKEGDSLDELSALCPLSSDAKDIQSRQMSPVHPFDLRWLDDWREQDQALQDIWDALGIDQITPPTPADIARRVKEALRAGSSPASAAEPKNGKENEVSRVAPIIGCSSTGSTAASNEANVTELLEAIVNLSAGWDADGSTGPRHPLSWETVGRMALDLARAALRASALPPSARVAHDEVPILHELSTAKSKSVEEFARDVQSAIHGVPPSAPGLDVEATKEQLIAAVEQLQKLLGDARADVVRMAAAKIGNKCEHHKEPLAELERLAQRECPICWMSAAKQAEAEVESLRSRLAAGRRRRAPETEQIIKDASEIRSSYGFLLMRLAVAESVQDTYDVVKREFTEHEAAFARLEKSIPAYGSAEWHALAAGSSPSASEQEQR